MHNTDTDIRGLYCDYLYCDRYWLVNQYYDPIHKIWKLCNIVEENVYFTPEIVVL